MTQYTCSLANKTTRADHLDTLRAIACLALVSYHVVGNNPGAGMELPRDHWLLQLNGTFIDMRMPLFSFLSGCVFVSLERLTRSPGQLLVSKTRRLLVPMLSVGALFWTANTLMGQDQPHILNLLVLPYAHFWFLQATFVIMACFLLLYALLPLHSTALATGLMLAGGALWIVELRPAVNVFSMFQAAYLMPFFMLGYLCAHSKVLPRLLRRLTPIRALTILAALIALGYTLSLSGTHSAAGLERRALKVAIGMIFCVTVLALAPRHPALAKLGGYSYTIYLFHVFFTAASFMALSTLAPNAPDALVWGAGLVMGTAGPVVLHQVLMRNDMLAAVFLGLRLNKAHARLPAVAQSRGAQRA